MVEPLFSGHQWDLSFNSELSSSQCMELVLISRITLELLSEMGVYLKVHVISKVADLGINKCFRPLSPCYPNPNPIAVPRCTCVPISGRSTHSGRLLMQLCTAVSASCSTLELTSSSNCFAITHTHELTPK